MAAPLVYNGDFQITGTSDTDIVGWTSNNSTAARNYLVGAGNRALLLRDNPISFAEQTVNFTSAGTYKLTFKIGWIVEAGATGQITIDGSPVWAGVADLASIPAASVLHARESDPFTVAAGPRVLRIGITSTDGYGMFLDDFVIVEAAPATTPGRLVCLGPGRTGLVQVS